MTETAAAPRTKGWRPDDSTFGARLALVRQHMAWGNIKEAATACGLPVESWRTWERDNVLPRRHVEVAAIIAEKTGCEYLWLLLGPNLGPLTGQQQPTNAHSPASTNRTRPNGYPKRTSPRSSTRRPALNPAALAHA